MLDGKQIRVNRPTMEEALTEKQDYERKALNLAPLASVPFQGTSEQAREAEAMFHRLKGTPHTLTQSVEWFLANFRPAVNASTVAAAVALFLEEKKRERVAHHTQQNLRFRLGALLKSIPEGKMVADMLPDDVSKFIFRTTTKARGKRTQINDRVALSNFFNWCVSPKKFCAVSPVTDVKPPKARGRGVPVTLSLSQCRALLTAAKDYKSGRTVPYFVLSLFGGLRPTEAVRMDWPLIDLAKAKRLDVSPEVTKTSEHRYATLPANVLEWLTPHALTKTPCKITRSDFDAVKELAGLTAWPQKDVLRHTAVSMFLAEFKNTEEAVERHGHSVQVMLKHYRGRVRPEEAKEFWTLTPDNVSAAPVPMREAKAA